MRNFFKSNAVPKSLNSSDNSLSAGSGAKFSIDNSANAKQGNNRADNLNRSHVEDGGLIRAASKDKAIIQTAVIYSDGRIYSNESSITLEPVSAGARVQSAIEAEVDTFLVGLQSKFDANLNQLPSWYPYFESNSSKGDSLGSNSRVQEARDNLKSQYNYGQNMNHNNNAIMNPVSGLQGLNLAANFKETVANKGAFGGERIVPGIDNSAAIPNNQKIDVNSYPITVMGQVKPMDPVDKIKVEDRKLDIKTNPFDSGGARVNHSSHERVYSFEDYEKSVLIDPDRHLMKGKRDSPDNNNKSTAASAVVPFEVAAVGSKIKNMHKVGGERVKEMDHYVAEVEVPVMKYMLSDGSTNLKQTEIGKLVQLKTRDVNLKNSISVSFRGRNNAISVENVYFDNGSVPEYILTYTKLFIDLIEIVCRILAIDIEIIKFFYMRTVRCNEFICFCDDNNVNIWLNVLVFQQGKNCDLKDNNPLMPLQISRSKLKELLVYWITRISSSIEPDRTKPRGLYDNNVWNRLQFELSRLSLPSAPEHRFEVSVHSQPTYQSATSPHSEPSLNSKLIAQKTTNDNNIQGPALAAQSKPLTLPSPSSSQLSQLSPSSKVTSTLPSALSIPQHPEASPELTIHREAVESLSEIFPHMSQKVLLSHLRQNNFNLSVTIENILQNC